jgi:UDP-N-acetylglucosamine--N-acetylmuramyl-(pentapeptide) pyrophosphoryl-undecaprenol N-acetylglucosamine transferase
MVVVPYPHAAAHQTLNARELTQAGAAQLVRDENFDAEALVGAADLACDRPRLAAMSQAARALGRPNAAAAQVALLESLAADRPLPDHATIEQLSREAA